MSSFALKPMVNASDSHRLQIETRCVYTDNNMQHAESALLSYTEVGSDALV